MGINDDEEPRILVELTVVDPNAVPPAPPTQVPEEKPQIAQAAVSQPEVSPKKDKRVKSYMNPIGNLKNKGAPATAPPPTTQPAGRRPGSPLKQNPSNKSISKPDPTSAGRAGRISKPADLPPAMKKAIQVQDIQQILDQNPTKR